MLSTLGSLSRLLRWTKPVVLLLGIASFSLFIATLFQLAGIETDIYLMPSVLGVLWSLLFFFLLSTFPHVPPKPDKELSWFKRLKVRLQRGIYYLLGTLFIILTLAAIRITFSMLGIWGDTF